MVYKYFIFVYRRLLVMSMTCLFTLGLLSGCTITSGLQSGALPESGTFTAENGLQFHIQPLSLATLPRTVAANPTQDLYQLIKTSGRVSYGIAKGDILNIILTNYPDINASTASLTVDQQGFVQFPLIGRIQASGMSVPQFTAALQSKLQRYLKYSDPQVKIINYRGSKFFVDGAVKQSGEFAIADVPISVYGAISMAGGTSESGDSNNIVLNRQGSSYQLGIQSLQKMGLSANQIYLRDGDAIHVNSQSRNKVYVLGEFGKIEPVAIPEQGLSLAHVLGESNGLNSNTANAAKVYIVRDNPQYQYTNIYYVDMQSITSLALASRFDMQANDILYVDPTGLARWNRIVSAILPSTSAINVISGL